MVERELNVEEMRQILHDEKWKPIIAETERKNKEIEKQEAKDKEIFRLREHWTGQKATVTDVARDINPVRLKILDITEASERRLEAHYHGIIDGLKIRLAVVAMLVLLYVI